MDSILPQLLMNGIIAGAIYALVASGFSLIYNVAKFLHFAHGGVLGAAAFLAFLFSKTLGLNFALSVILAVGLTMCLGVLLNYTTYRPLRKRNATAPVLLIASLALLILIDATLLAIFGADVKTLPLAQNVHVFELFGLRISAIQLAIIVASIVLFVLLTFVMKKTRLGKAMRALADNKDVAQTVGINPERIYFWAFLISSLLAGIAGVLVGLEQNIFPMMGAMLIVKGFIGAVIGGLGSVPGAILGSFILGIVENLGIWQLPSGYKDAIAFVLLFLFLLFRPQGLLTPKLREA